MKRGLLLSSTFGIALLAISTEALAQKTTAPGTSPGTSPGTAPGSPGAPNVPNTPSPQRFPDSGRQQMPDFQRQIYVSGKVMLDDGTPPPESILVERVCNGTPRPEGYTDSKGRFSFQLGQNSAILADASSSSMGDSRFGTPATMASGSPGSAGISSTSLMGCELRAVLPGFQSDTVQLYGKRALENPDVGTIVLHRLAKVEGYTFSGTTAFAPKDAQKAYSKARESLKKKKWDDAERDLVKATETYPKYAVAWADLGRLYQSQGKVDAAKTAYAQAMQADGKYIVPYEMMTRISAYEADWQKTLEVSDKAIKLNPYLSPEVYYYNAVANFQLKNLDAAEQSAREALKKDPQHRIPKTSEVLGVILANKQDFTGASEHLKQYLQFNPDAKDADTVRKQLAEVERMQAAKTEAAK